MEKEIYTPYGFRDRLFAEASQQRAVSERIRKTFSMYGYLDIQTPMVEYLKVYDEERGSIAPVDMYKFVDRDGELLVLRPDLTPAAARVATTYLKEEDLPCRMTMSGNTFRYNGRYSAKQRELYQTGVELIGTDSAAADAEVLEVAVESLKSAGLTEFKIAIGHAKLVEQILQLTAESVRPELQEHIVSKNFPALYQKLDQQKIEPEIRELLELTAGTGGIELIEKGLSCSEKLGLTQVSESLRRLLEVHEILTDAGLEEFLVYDPGMTVDLHYYTGIVFQGYTYGTGDYIMDGGRYDDLLKQFSRDWPAVGFGIYVNSLLSAMERQRLLPETEKMVFLAGTEEKAVLKAARRLRQKGCAVAVQQVKDAQVFEQFCQESELCGLGVWLDPEELGLHGDEALTGKLEELSAWLKEGLFND